MMSLSSISLFALCIGLTSASNEEDDTLDIPKVWPTPMIVVTAILSVVQVLVVAWAVIFLLAIIWNKAVRARPYNIYLVFLVFPDVLANIVGAVVPLVRAFSDSDAEPFAYTHIWVSVFYYTSNFWLNFTIAYEVHKVARKAFHNSSKAALATDEILTSGPSLRTVYSGPSLQTVYIQCSILYGIAILVATWFTLPVSWSPMHVGGEDTKVVKFGSPEGGTFSSLGGFLVVVLLVMLVPTIYVLYVRFDVWRRQLLPKTGRTRVFSLFFLRILLIFFGFYYPNVIVTLIRSKTKSETFWYISNILKRVLDIMQVVITIYLASKKDDVEMAIKSLIGRGGKNNDNKTRALQTEEEMSQNDVNEWDDEDVYEKQGTNKKSQAVEEYSKKTHAEGKEEKDMYDA